MSRTFDFELLIMRHGDAASWAEGGDAARPLTEKGRASIAQVAKAFENLEWYWSLAFASPYLRAQETKDIVSEHLELAFERDQQTQLAKAETTELLIPQADPEALARMLVAQGTKLGGPRPRIAVFGHNPLLSRLAGLLVGGDRATQFAMGRGDVVHLFVPAPSPFDLILDPKEEEPLPRAVVLGFYTQQALVALGG